MITYRVLLWDSAGVLYDVIDHDRGVRDAWHWFRHHSRWVRREIGGYATWSCVL